MSIYTTQGLMTSADMEDMRDLYDLDCGQQEEEAMEAAHAAHVDGCRACQEDNSQRETTAKVALALDDARRALEKGIQGLLTSRTWTSPEGLEVKRALEEALEASRKALRSL